MNILRISPSLTNLERIALSTPLDHEIQSRLAAVLASNMTLRDFYRWFVPATWEVERTENPEAIRLTHDLAHLFSELSAGILTRDEVRQALEVAASTSTTSDRQRIA